MPRLIVADRPSRSVKKKKYRLYKSTGGSQEALEYESIIAQPMKPIMTFVPKYIHSKIIKNFQVRGVTRSSRI